MWLISLGLGAGLITAAAAAMMFQIVVATVCDLAGLIPPR
jgi:hypothetical protein